MKIDIHIPWRNTGCFYRERACSFISNYYSQIANVIHIDSSHTEFNRANARNLCVANSTKDVVIIIDADNYIDHDQILYGVEMAMIDNSIVRPFNSIHYLNQDATDRFLTNANSFTPKYSDYEYMAPDSISLKNSGGAYITPKNLWIELSGMDELFTGWGLEDLSFNNKYEHYYGSQMYINGPNYNLYHPSERTASEKSWDRYRNWYQSGRIYEG